MRRGRRIVGRHDGGAIGRLFCRFVVALEVAFMAVVVVVVVVIVFGCSRHPREQRQYGEEIMGRGNYC